MASPLDFHSYGHVPREVALIYRLLKNEHAAFIALHPRNVLGFMEKFKKEEGCIGKFTRYKEMALVICTTARGPKLANGQDPYGVGQLGASRMFIF